MSFLNCFNMGVIKFGCETASRFGAVLLSPMSGNRMKRKNFSIARSSGGRNRILLIFFSLWPLSLFFGRDFRFCLFLFSLTTFSFLWEGKIRNGRGRSPAKRPATAGLRSMLRAQRDRRIVPGKCLLQGNSKDYGEDTSLCLSSRGKNIF